MNHFAAGPDFLSWIDQSQESQTQCVLLDVRMPTMSGLEVHDQLRARGSNVPVIYMTGHGDVPIAVEAMKKGAVTFLEKPLDSNELEKALDIAYYTTAMPTKLKKPLRQSPQPRKKTLRIYKPKQHSPSAMPA